MLVQRRSYPPLLAALAIVLCLSVWQMIGCPGPPPAEHGLVPLPPPSGPQQPQPVYTLLTPNNGSGAASAASMEPPFSLDDLPVDDYSSLIDVSHFRFTTLNLVCNDSLPAPLLLVLVHSAPANVDKRRVIRETWGTHRDSMRLVFLFGEARNAKQQRQLDKENILYRDLVQGNYRDAYRNMTYKHVMALKYAIYHCPTARYILKTDDDVFINMPTLMAFLSIEFSAWGARKLLMCTPYESAPVKRSYRSKWRVSFSEYSERTYPTYCPGYTLLYSPDVAFMLYREAQKTRYFWIDDVHITGVLAKRLQLVHTSVWSLVLDPGKVKRLVAENSTETLPAVFLYGSPDLGLSTIYRLWSIVLGTLDPHSPATPL